MLKIFLKSGDSLILQGQAKVAGVPQDLTGWEIRSDVVADGVKIASMELTYLDRSIGTYQLRYDDTENWHSRRTYMDIKYISTSLQKMSTETIHIVLSPGETE